VSVFERIDLERHGVIEASAGTGKTYTIEQLFLRILCDRQITIDKILVLTYTEKATSELKIRIRSGIENRLRDSHGKLRERLEQALDCFDMAAIHTIHGFCNRVLAEYAFENRSLFEAEFVDENSLMEEAYYEVLRKDVPAMEGPTDLLLELAEWAKKDLYGFRFDQLVFELARRIKPENGDELQPELNGLSLCVKTAGTLLDSLCAKYSEDWFVNFIKEYEELPFHARSRSANLRNALLPLQSLLKRYSKDKDQSAALTAVNLICKWLDSQGASRIKPSKYNKGANPNPALLEELDELVERLQSLLLSLEKLRVVLSIYCVEKVHKEARRIRESEALHGFQDLIEGVRLAVREPSSALIQRLQEQYSYALIDEFQDTDPAQWEILKRVFLQGGSRSRLYLVGDPKQAIYAFRGADLPTYERAVEEMLADEGNSSLHSLEQNFRSTPGLLSPLNQLFSNQNWFGSTRYSVQVEAPIPELQRHGLLEFPDPRGSINFLRLELQNKEFSLGTLAEFIASEIHFLNENSAYRILEGGSERKGNWGDFCVLIRSRNELIYLKKAFQGIPHFVYKKPGVFLSQEALELNCILRAIARPFDPASLRIALLTSFLDWSLFDLDALEDPFTAESIYKLFASWRELALREDWGNLFSSLLRETRVGPQGVGTPGWDESYSILGQICETLLVEAKRRHLDLPALIDFLNRLYHRDEVLGDEASYHRLMEEEGKVRIMTIHASKGLEFPVVFLFNLYQSASRGVVSHPITGSAGSRYYVGRVPGEARELHRAEIISGMKRLYYVALTRAQHSLYLPMLEAAQVKDSKVSRAKASEFYEEVVGPSILEVSAHPHARSLDLREDSLQEPETVKPLSVDQRDDSQDFEADFQTQKIPRGFLSPLAGLDLNSRAGSGIDSFSSLRKRSETNFLDGRSKDFSERWADPLEEVEGRLEEHEQEELPGGWQVGSMLHEILERLDFERLLSITSMEQGIEVLLQDPIHSFFPELVFNACDHYGVSRSFLNPITTLILRTLLSPVKQVDSQFRILDLKQDQMIREPEFFLSLSADPQPYRPGERGERGFLNGFMDLVFEYQGKVFLVDWKSNRIAQGYDPQSLSALMEEEDYILQYRIYTLALLRWLRWRLGDSFSFEKRFGGVLYLFLRGLNPDGQDGVFYYLPESEEEVEGYLTDIIQRSEGVNFAHGS
jgi:exodeoxyribonuclease V beta subunit